MGSAGITSGLQRRLFVLLLLPLTVLALRDQTVPPLLNLAQPDAWAEGMDLVRGQARPVAMAHALLNGFGFGGVNASLVLGRYPG